MVLGPPSTKTPYQFQQRSLFFVCKTEQAPRVVKFHHSGILQGWGIRKDFPRNVLVKIAHLLDADMSADILAFIRLF